MTQALIDFDGPTYDRVLDERRLKTQLHRVFKLMRDGKWRTLNEIALAVEGSEAGVSARLRDLRKPRFGMHTVISRRLGPRLGVWQYQLIERKEP